MEEKRILYVSSEVVPYLAENEVSLMSYDVPKMINDQGGQIRIFMPRYGNINERRHQLHEVIRLSGMNLVVNDLDKSKDFWMKSLGFQLHIEALEQSPYIDELLAIKDPNLTTVKLIDSKGFIIELLKFDNYQVDKSWSGDLKTTGITHIALTVDNLDALVDNLKKQNYQTLSEIKTSPNKKVKVVFVSGPEGIMLELVQELV